MRKKRRHTARWLKHYVMLDSAGRRKGRNSLGIFVDRDVHLPRGYRLSRDSALPSLDVPDYSPGVNERIGSLIRDYAPGSIGGASIGALVGARRIGGAILGVVAVEAFRRRRLSRVLGTESAPDRRGAIRVVQLNVHGGMGGPGKFFATPVKLDTLAEAIRAENPDIVLVQELDRCALRSNFTDTISELAVRLRPDSAVMVAGIEKPTGRREGPGVLTFNGTKIIDARALRIDDAFGETVRRRFTALVDAWVAVVAARVGRRWQPFGGVPEYQPRAVADVLVVTPDSYEIRVMSGHFSPPHDGVDELRRQLESVVATIGSWSGATILGADFNTRDGSAECEREHRLLESAGMSEATFGAPDNSDRIYISAHFVAGNPCKRDVPPGVTPPSDHAVVVVDLYPNTCQVPH